mgnify:CR=1 FL=1
MYENPQEGKEKKHIGIRTHTPKGALSLPLQCLGSLQVLYPAPLTSCRIEAIILQTEKKPHPWVVINKQNIYLLWKTDSYIKPGKFDETQS